MPAAEPALAAEARASLSSLAARCTISTSHSLDTGRGRQSSYLSPSKVLLYLWVSFLSNSSGLSHDNVRLTSDLFSSSGALTLSHFFELYASMYLPIIKSSQRLSAYSGRGIGAIGDAGSTGSAGGAGGSGLARLSVFIHILSEDMG